MNMKKKPSLKASENKRNFFSILREIWMVTIRRMGRCQWIETDVTKSNTLVSNEKDGEAKMMLEVKRQKENRRCSLDEFTDKSTENIFYKSLLKYERRNMKTR